VLQTMGFELGPSETHFPMPRRPIPCIPPARRGEETERRDGEFGPLPKLEAIGVGDRATSPSHGAHADRPCSLMLLYFLVLPPSSASLPPPTTFSLSPNQTGTRIA
jgi:hypothetical protein